MTTTPTCPVCKEKFKAKETPYVKGPEKACRYYHVDCYKEKFPNTEFEIIYPEEKKEKEADNMFQYLKKQKIKYNYFLCMKQRKNYIENFGYTDEGILTALKYFFEVKNGEAKSEYGIGIVPYVYEEAQAYYKELNKAKKRIAESLKKQDQIKLEKITVTQPRRQRKKEYIDLDKIGE